MTDAKVEKFVNGAWQQDNGHLKVWKGNKRISNDYQVAPGQVLDIQSLTFKLNLFLGKPMAYEVYIFGYDLLTGHIVEFEQSISYDPLEWPTQHFVPIGNGLASLGMNVSYPDPETLEVDVVPSQIFILETWFTVYEDWGPSSGPYSLTSFSYDID